MRQLFKEYHITALIVLLAGIIFASQIHCAIEKRQHISRRSAWLEKKSSRLDRDFDLRYRLAKSKFAVAFKREKEIYKIFIRLEAWKLYRLKQAGYHVEAKVLPAAFTSSIPLFHTSLKKRPPSGGRPAYKSRGGFFVKSPPSTPQKTFVYSKAKAQPAKEKQ